MTIKSYPLKVFGECDGAGVYSVETMDECCANVNLIQVCHTVETWRETAQAIEKALIMLELEVHDV
jgi:hypothetical protein